MKDITIPNGRETAARDDRPRWRPFGVFPPPPPPAGPRRRPAVLALGALAVALVLGAGEAAAQTGVCAGDPPTPGARIDCTLGNIANDINIDARNVAISVTTGVDTFQHAVDARTTGGTGNIIIRLGQGLEVMTSGASFRYGGYGRNRGTGDVSIVMEDGASIVTAARYGFGIAGVVDDTGSGDVFVRMTGGSVETTGADSSGMILQHYTTGAMTADMTGGSIRVTGGGSSGIRLTSGGSGAATATFSGGSIEKSGGASVAEPVAGGIAFAGGTTSTADVSIGMTGGSITTSGAGNNPGVLVDHQGTGDVSIRMTGGSITTSGDGSNHGMFVHHQGTGEADVSIRMAGGSITAAGTGISHGVFVRHEGSGGVVDVDLTGGSITTSRDSSHGVVIFLNGTANPDGISIESGGAISTSGDGSHGMHVINAGTGNIHVAMTGGTIDASGAGSVGINIAGHRGRSTVTVNGMVRGGTGTGAAVSIVGRGEVVVGRNARIVARQQDGRAIFGGSDGELVVTIVDPDELGDTNAPRIQGRIVKDAEGSLRVRFRRSGSAEAVELRAGGAPVGSGPWDVSVEEDGDGLRVVRELGPRTRLYEALPSVLLGMNGLPRFEERMAAARTERGGWARVEASRGEWKADVSTTGVEYKHRRSGLRAGLDVPAGENGLFGVSVHHRLGSADVSRGGDVKLSGSGAGVSGTWFGDAAYVDVQGEVTWYEADLGSIARGTLKKEASGRGHAVGVEVGRRVAMPEMGEGVVLTPRAGLVHSKVSVDDFTDAVGARVSVDEARSLKGRLGVVVEREADGSPNRLSGSLDVEHEFSDDMKVRMTGMDLTPEAEATWVRVGLNGSHGWGDGRYTLRGGVSYATSGESYEVGGGVSLEVRF